MQAYEDPDHNATLDDWAFSLAFAQDQAIYAFHPTPMQPCRNLDCTNESYAIFCSESCRLVIESDTDTYYSDGEGVLLGHRQLSDDQAAADGHLVAKACGYAPAVAAPVQAFSEAPISCTVKGYRNGQDVMVTIRGTDFAHVQAQVEAAAQWFDRPAVQAPAASTTGETGEDWCPVHATQMRWNPGKSGERGWWSHKAAEGWCKGTPKAKGQVRHG